MKSIRLHGEKNSTTFCLYFCLSNFERAEKYCKCFLWLVFKVTARAFIRDTYTDLYDMLKCQWLVWNDLMTAFIYWKCLICIWIKTFLVILLHFRHFDLDQIKINTLSVEGMNKARQKCAVVVTNINFLKWLFWNYSEFYFWKHLLWWFICKKNWTQSLLQFNMLNFLHEAVTLR